MARGGGSVEAGGIYHIISRFVAREWFIESAVERRMYLALLGAALASSDWTCFSFAVMSSHIHLGLVAGTERLAEWMRPMHTVFANWMNARRERIGGVFVKGPNVITVPPGECARLINYIHYNPVRARVVAQPLDSDWTSYRAYVGAASRRPWLSVEGGLALGGFVDADDFAAWSSRHQSSKEDLIAAGVMPKAGRGRPCLPRRSAARQEAASCTRRVI